MASLLDEIQPVENRDMVLCVIAWLVSQTNEGKVSIPLKDLNYIYDQMKAGLFHLYQANPDGSSLTFKVENVGQISSQV